MKKIYCTILLLVMFNLHSQTNCDAYKYLGDTLKYKACKKANEAHKHYQFRKEFQEILDKSINIDSTYAEAYREKSTAYLKSGDFLMWKKLIDKAVKFNSKENLGYRGWCRYQFFRDYKGAITDIEKLDSLVNYDIGFSQNGDYHLNIVKALCYKAIQQQDTAIHIIEKQLSNKDHFVGIYDYLHLGVLYLEKEEFKEAFKAFKKQEIENDISENQYYLALTFKKLKNKLEYQKHLKKAENYYKSGKKMFDPYTNPIDKIYLENIVSEIRIAY